MTFGRTAADAISGCSTGLLAISKVVFPDSPQVLKLVFGNGRLCEIQAVDDSAEWVCLPPLVDKHVHANRAFTIGGSRPSSFKESLELATALSRRVTSQACSQQARRCFENALVHGTTGIRTHSDIDPTAKLTALHGTLQAKSSFASRMDIEVVAFASSQLDPLEPEGRALLQEAAAVGAELLGAVPALYAKPARSIDALLEMAALHRLPVDVHMDEALDPANSWTEYLADATLAVGLQGRVTLSHGCALAVLAPEDRNRILDKLLRAGIMVIALPLTNLYLQDRAGPEPRRRGLTCVHELLAAGIELRFGSDNVQDAFYPFGNLDLLDTAYVGMLGGQLDATNNLVKAICDGRTELAVGDPADLVLIKGSSFEDVLSRRPSERIVMRDGKVINPANTEMCKT